MTDVEEIRRLVEGYRAWLKDRTTLKSVHADWVEISTPFLDRHNDYIQLYAKKENGGFTITDDGHTIRDLEVSGCALDTPKRQSLLKVALNGFGVQEARGVLSVRASVENFSVRKHSLIQAIVAVNDLFYLAQPTIQSLFKEDVEKWLTEADVRFVSNIQLAGKSGYQHFFDFAIPRSRRAPERLVRAINNPNKDTALSLITAWTDTVEQRPTDTRALAILNDGIKPVPAPVLEALSQYDIGSIIWSQRYAERNAVVA